MLAANGSDVCEGAEIEAKSFSLALPYKPFSFSKIQKIVKEKIVFEE